MKIALLGYGKMGKAIENVALERGHSIGATLDNKDDWSQKSSLLANCDIAVDFSQPDVAVENIRKCFSLQIPVVVGTTGWYDHLEELRQECLRDGHTLFVASNFSIGMNIMFDLNRRLAHLMNRYPDYDIRIAETHHIHKLDAPSGTAISLAKDAMEELDSKTCWRLVSNEEPSDPGAIPITSYRIGEVPGIHEVVYDSEIDTITLSHSAKSRRGLALGAVLAAEYAAGKKGFLSMKDLLADGE